LVIERFCTLVESWLVRPLFLASAAFRTDA
jgi:hypothetical protein